MPPWSSGPSTTVPAAAFTSPPTQQREYQQPVASDGHGEPSPLSELQGLSLLSLPGWAAGNTAAGSPPHSLAQRLGHEGQLPRPQEGRTDFLRLTCKMESL